MIIKEFMKYNNITINQAINNINCSRMSFYRWLKKEAIPNLKNMKKIIEWSHGAVQPSDFYDISIPMQAESELSATKETGG